jgi:hypothetical protein
VIVTTAHGRYHVEEIARGWFVFTLLAALDHPPFVPATQLNSATGTTTVRRAPLRLAVGLGFCYDVAGVQQVDCGCNRITAIEPEEGAMPMIPASSFLDETDGGQCAYCLNGPPVRPRQIDGEVVYLCHACWEQEDVGDP